MVKLGEILNIQEELYEVIRTLKVRMGKNIPLDLIDEIKKAWMVEKVFKHGEVYYFVNEITTIEPSYEQDTNTGEAN